MDLEMRDLKLVAAVSECGSLTRAGDRLHVTQSALSHQLKELEGKLGTPVFLRLNKRMLLTPAGERLLETARQVLEQLDAAEQAIKALSLERRQPLRISAECYTVYHWLPALLKVFRQKFPSVEVRIDVDSTPRPLARLLEGKLDLAVLMSPVRDRRIVLRPLFRDEMILVLSSAHRLADVPWARLSDLAGERLFLYAPKEQSFVCQRLLGPAGVVPESIEQVQLTEAMVELIKANLGVSVLARWAVEPYLKSGDLRGLRLGPRGLYRQWYGAVLKHEAEAPHLVEFQALLARQSLPVRFHEAAAHPSRPVPRRDLHRPAAIAR